MSTTQQNIREQKTQTQLKLIIVGAILLIGWTFALGVTTWLQDLPCVLSPDSCSAGNSLAQLILFTPLIAGSGLMAAGVLYNMENLPRPLKLLAGMAIMGVLLFVAFWAITFIGISIHGLDG